MPLIDFIGPPGSGKTTLVNTLLKRNPGWLSLDKGVYSGLRAWLHARNKRGLSFLPFWLGRRIYPGIYPANMLARYYRQNIFRDEGQAYDNYFDYILSALPNLEIPGHARAALYDRLANHAAYDYFLRQNHISDRYTVLADEYFAHSCLSLHAIRSGNASDSQVRAYADTIPVPEYLVRIDMAEETCLQRLQNRPRGLPTAWENLSETDIGNRFARIRDVQTIFCKHLQERGTRIIQVDNMDITLCCTEIEKADMT